MIPYSHQSIDEDDIQSVIRVLKSDWLTQGPTVNEFEQKLLAYCGAKYAVVFSSGTAALHGAYSAAGLRCGDEFITSPLTFAATANAGLYLGARPVFADIDDHGNLDPIDAEKKITKKTKLIAVVDYAGLPANLSAFRRLANKHNVVLVEDACQALGASYRGKKVGSLCDLTVFSFHPVKSITTGEGGAVVTDNAEYYRALLSFRTHGITKEQMVRKGTEDGDWYYEMRMLGYNYRLTDIQAALGISQLNKLDRFVRARKKLAARYTKALKKFSDYLILPKEAVGTTSAWHLYPVRLNGVLAQKRKEIFQHLRAAGIGVQVHHIPVYLHPYYQKLGYAKGLCPRAEKFYQTEISLPLFPTLAEKEQATVLRAVIALIT